MFKRKKSSTTIQDPSAVSPDTLASKRAEVASLLSTERENLRQLETELLEQVNRFTEECALTRDKTKQLSQLEADLQQRSESIRQSEGQAQHDREDLDQRLKELEDALQQLEHDRQQFSGSVDQLAELGSRQRSGHIGAKHFPA